jgi:hypothetical protein
MEVARPFRARGLVTFRAGYGTLCALTALYGGMATAYGEL